MRSEGYGTWSVRLCVCVCVSVCLSTLTLDLQATRRFTSGTNGISATRARKIMWRILLKRPRLRARNWHCRGQRCVAQPINYRCACVLITSFPYAHALDWFCSWSLTCSPVLHKCTLHSGSSSLFQTLPAYIVHRRMFAETVQTVSTD